MNKRGIIDKLVTGVPVFLLLVMLIALYLILTVAVSSNGLGKQDLSEANILSIPNANSFMFKQVEVNGGKSLFFNELLVLTRLKVAGDNADYDKKYNSMLPLFNGMCFFDMVAVRFSDKKEFEMNFEFIVPELKNSDYYLNKYPGIVRKNESLIFSQNGEGYLLKINYLDGCSKKESS